MKNYFINSDNNYVWLIDKCPVCLSTLQLLNNSELVCCLEKFKFNPNNPMFLQYLIKLFIKEDPDTLVDYIGNLQLHLEDMQKEYNIKTNRQELDYVLSETSFNYNDWNPPPYIPGPKYNGLDYDHNNDYKCTRELS